MAGLFWNETDQEHYAAQSGDFKYELYRDTTGRWTGHVRYAAALLASDRSCNSIATQADYLVSLCRYRLTWSYLCPTAPPMNVTPGRFEVMAD